MKLKHLKYFESMEYQHHINAIRDVFQDIFDDWNMEELNSMIDRNTHGLYYNFRALDSDIVFCIRNIDSGKLINIPTIDISNHIKTLKSMGYVIEDKRVNAFILLIISYENI